MSADSNREIFSSRVLNASVEIVYKAFADPSHLKKWWGPEGFTNTIHEFDLRPGGNWVLSMHGPDKKGHYKNASVFKTVEPLKVIAWKRHSEPLFDMEVGFEKLSDSTTRISFRMIFATAEECTKIRKFVEPKNEENFDRLEKELVNVVV
jgi:uncharacterized protein YndB with AHSA1/START domain